MTFMKAYTYPTYAKANQLIWFQSTFAPNAVFGHLIHGKSVKCFDQNNGPFLPECSSFHKLQGSFKRALSKQAAIMYRDKAGVNATSEPHNATLKTQEHQFVIDFRSIFHNFLFKKSSFLCYGVTPHRLFESRKKP